MLARGVRADRASFRPSPEPLHPHTYPTLTQEEDSQCVTLLDADWYLNFLQVWPSGHSSTCMLEADLCCLPWPSPASLTSSFRSPPRSVGSPIHAVHRPCQWKHHCSFLLAHTTEIIWSGFSHFSLTLVSLAVMLDFTTSLISYTACLCAPVISCPRCFNSVFQWRLV